MRNIQDLIFDLITEAGTIEGFTTRDMSGNPEFNENELGCSCYTKYYGSKPMILLKNADPQVKEKVESIGRTLRLKNFVWRKMGAANPNVFLDFRVLEVIPYQYD